MVHLLWLGKKEKYNFPLLTKTPQVPGGKGSMKVKVKAAEHVFLPPLRSPGICSDDSTVHWRLVTVPGVTHLHTSKAMVLGRTGFPAPLLELLKDLEYWDLVNLTDLGCLTLPKNQK